MTLAQGADDRFSSADFEVDRIGGQNLASVDVEYNESANVFGVRASRLEAATEDRAMV